MPKFALCKKSSQKWCTVKSMIAFQIINQGVWENFSKTITQATKFEIEFQPIKDSC